MNRLLSVVFLISGLWISTPAYADCSNPAGAAGDMNYNADYAVPQYCDGTAWQAIGHPADLCVSFTNQSNVALNSTITSNTVVLQGGWTNWTVTCGAGCTAISINGAAFVAGPVTGVDGGDTIAIRQTSSSIGYTTTTATVTVGTVTSDTWSVTTECYNNTSEIGCLQADGTVYAGLSPDGNVPMYAMPCDLGMTGTHDNCTGTRTTYRWGTYGKGTGYESTVTGESNTTGLIADYSTYDDGYSIGVPAAQACADQTFGGHSDWYLPAKDEQFLFWLAPIAVIGGFNTGINYWASSDHDFDANRCWIMQFNDENQCAYAKANIYYVRCVRR